MSVLRLKDLREDMDMKQEDVARILGISRQYYSRYEIGSVELPIRHYKALAKFYNVSIDFICGLSDEPRSLGGGVSLSAKEMKLIKNYKKNPLLQKAVDKILDL